MSTDEWETVCIRDHDYRWMYWNAWTGDLKWVKRARVQAEGRIAADKLGRAIRAPFGAILDRLSKNAN